MSETDEETRLGSLKESFSDLNQKVAHLPLYPIRPTKKTFGKPPTKPQGFTRRDLGTRVVEATLTGGGLAAAIKTGETIAKKTAEAETTLFQKIINFLKTRYSQQTNSDVSQEEAALKRTMAKEPAIAEAKAEDQTRQQTFNQPVAPEPPPPSGPPLKTPGYSPQLAPKVKGSP